MRRRRPAPAAAAHSSPDARPARTPALPPALRLRITSPALRAPRFNMENKHWWWLAAGLMLLSLAAAVDPELPEAEHELLVRQVRGAKNRETCRYVRGSWSDCDSKTNIRSRKLTLKKGDPANCESIKTIQKKCKKACRYEKSSWSECSPNGEMSRTDALKANSDPTCEKNRRITKKCNKNKQAKSAKDKGRRNRQ